MKKSTVFILSLFMMLMVGSQSVLANNRIDASAAIMADVSTRQIIYKQNVDKALPGGFNYKIINYFGNRR